VQNIVSEPITGTDAKSCVFCQNYHVDTERTWSNQICQPSCIRKSIWLHEIFLVITIRDYEGSQLTQVYMKNYRFLVCVFWERFDVLGTVSRMHPAAVRTLT